MRRWDKCSKERARFDIVVRFAPQFRSSPEAIAQILVQSPKGVQLPLVQLAQIEEVIGPRQITREKSQRFITVQCNVTDRDIGSFVADAQQAIADQVDLPPGYLVTWGGQFRLQQEANKRLAIVVPITLFVLFLLLFSSFNSLKNATLILLNIPLALVGGVVALWLTGQNLSVPSSVGFIALFGIALENSMVMVTYFNQLVRDGVDLDEASIQGACLRVRPVLMTALTTALWADSAAVFQRHRQRSAATASYGSRRWLGQFHRADLAGAAGALQVVCCATESRRSRKRYWRNGKK